MEVKTNHDTDGSSIKPVSSLLSHFESIGQPRHPLHHASTSAAQDEMSHVGGTANSQPSPEGRIPNDARAFRGTQRVPDSSKIDRNLLQAQPDWGRPDSPSKSRPMLVSSYGRSPSRVDIQSSHTSSMQSFRPHTHHGFLTPAAEKHDSQQPPSQRHFRIPSRSRTPFDEHNVEAFAQTIESRSTEPSPLSSGARLLVSQAPPPVNREAKRKLQDRQAEVLGPTNDPKSVAQIPDQERSPFSTPPSSAINSPEHEHPPPLPSYAKPTLLPTGASVASRIDLPPIHHTVPGPRRHNFFPHGLHMHSPIYNGQFTSDQRANDNDDPSRRPTLPPRKDSAVPEAGISRPPSREPKIRRSTEMGRPSALTMGFSTKLTTSSKQTHTPETIDTLSPNVLPQPRIVRQASPRPVLEAASVVSRRPGDVSRALAEKSRPVAIRHDSGEPANVDINSSLSFSEYPDISWFNRRPPLCLDGPRTIPVGYEARLFDVSGDLVCTTGNLTRVWSLTTGKLLLSMAHEEHMRITAVAFKPSRRVEEEGNRLWLGTNYGEIQEIDIVSKRLARTNSAAHPRREITSILRNGAELWTLDVEGKLYVWPPDESGTPDLTYSTLNCRVSRGHTASMIVDRHLWLASGKEIRVYQPSTSTGATTSQLTDGPLTQPNTGTISACATVACETDRVYFGHSDGKITAYSRKDHSCLGVFSVNLYKVNCLVGMGNYLWAGYSTGMIVIYDTRSYPWQVKKEWRAHDNPVVKIIVDHSNIWKTSQLQAVSLGMDNMIGIWDGMLEADWIDDEMLEHEIEYSTFRDLTALVVTWNVGAAKPQDLRHDEHDLNFFRDLFSRGEAPDIVVFGLQELVDLEDKRETAKNIFRSRNKDSYAQEHLSSVYRAWRDEFYRCLEDFMPSSESYTLVHTASMVGLFTCIFVRTSEKNSIRDVQAIDIKCGVGGLYGNKGAIVVRFMADDTSICFVNCHLAAGQTSTVHRNNDITTILDTSPLQASHPFDQGEATYVNGGDGSMILDHQICILNGDLNYRIDTMPRDTVIQAITLGNLPKLLDRDQLKLSCKRNPNLRLRAFIEAPISFLPTYKYDVDTDNYDSSDKKRIPAWCDRILYRCPRYVSQVDYRRHEVRISDHRPVSARFKLRVKTVQPVRRQACLQKCHERLEEVKKHEVEAAKLEQLMSLFELSAEEARKLLK